jgi:hypothetical protein
MARTTLRTWDAAIDFKPHGGELFEGDQDVFRTVWETSFVNEKPLV